MAHRVPDGGPPEVPQLSAVPDGDEGEIYLGGFWWGALKSVKIFFFVVTGTGQLSRRVAGDEAGSTGAISHDEGKGHGDRVHG